MNLPARGEVWWAEERNAGRRPVLVLTRDQAIPVLNALLVAPVTRTVRRIPTELALGPDDGLPQECAANFDNVRTIPRSALTERLGHLDPLRMLDACRALRAATAC